MIRLFSLLLAIAAPIPVLADDALVDRQEAYESLLYCAAFHTIEATRTQGDASEAQQATAYDYAAAAAKLAPAASVATTDAELKVLLGQFKEQLEKGDPREMAEQWTALESACQELHPLKEQLIARTPGETAPGEDAVR